MEELRREPTAREDSVSSCSTFSRLTLSLQSMSHVIETHPHTVVTRLMPQAVLVQGVPYLAASEDGDAGSSALSCLTSPCSEVLEALTPCHRCPQGGCLPPHWSPGPLIPLSLGAGAGGSCCLY